MFSSERGFTNKWTDKALNELKATRERVEAGDSSVFELVAERLVLESSEGRKGKIPLALDLYEAHDATHCRRSRRLRVDINTGTVIIPKLVRDLEDRTLP